MSRPAPFTPAQYERYQRHLSLPEIGPEGQQRLLAGSALLIGAGGLGCPIALYLAAAGVGRLGLIDADRIDRSNLQRQILYRDDEVGRPKAEVARERLRALNPEVEVTAHALRLHAGNALELLRGYQVVIDGTDNFPTRYLANDACVRLGIPLVSGAILRFEGQASVFDARRGPCYRCLFPEPPPPGSVPSCAEGGVLGVLPGLVGVVQATEAIKLLAGVGEPLLGRFLQLDALEMRFREFRFTKDPDCAVCSRAPDEIELIDYQEFCGMASQEGRAPVREISVGELVALRERGEPALLLDVREPAEWEKARIAGAVLIPLGELPHRLAELAEWKSRSVVVHCHHGGRSAQAVGLLQQNGFADVKNLAGGIEAWSLSVDPAVARY